jgi:cell division protein ZipA
LDSPSENASSILDKTKLAISTEKIDFENLEYEANPTIEWVIDINHKGSLFKKEDLWMIFDKDWRTKFNSADVYGHAPIDNKWHYVIAGGNPDNYDNIQVGVKLLDMFAKNEINISSKKLEYLVEDLQKRIAKFSTQVSIAITEDVASAVERAKKLFEMKQALSYDMIIILKADSSYTGLRAWDAMSSLGLRWGDGDLFHWNNDEHYGDDHYFTVWSTTPPGYFFPENVKEGKYNPHDLLFGYPVARSADPINIFDIMVESVKYCQKRLGGQILNRQGAAFNEAESRAELVKLVENMKAKGIQPGSLEALRIFD